MFMGTKKNWFQFFIFIFIVRGHSCGILYRYIMFGGGGGGGGGGGICEKYQSRDEEI